MIAYVNGIVQYVELTQKYLVVAVHDIGYKVYVPLPVLEKKSTGSSVELFTYHHVREDMQDLYGFLTTADLHLFERLISVSGVGPKVALALLSQLSAQDIRQAIIADDSSLLTQVPGVGKKIAERLLLELKHGMADDLLATSDTTGGSSDLVRALHGLGYTTREALVALRQVDHAAGVEEQIKQALVVLSHHSKRS